MSCICDAGAEEKDRQAPGPGPSARLDVQRQVLALAAAHAEAAVAAVPLRGRLRQALHAHRLAHLRAQAGPVVSQSLYYVLTAVQQHHSVTSSAVIADQQHQDVMANADIDVAHDAALRG